MSDGPIFVAAAAKTLSAVEVDAGASNQHELAAGSLRRLLIDRGLMGPDQERVEIPIRMLRLSADEEPERVDDHITVYDARRQQPDRGPEWRAYYGSDSPAERLVHTMRAGDLMVHAFDLTGSVIVLLASADSHWPRLLEETLAITAQPQLMVVPEYDLADAQRKTPIALIADALDIHPGNDSDEEWLLAHFGGTMPAVFPDTHTMAALAHERVGQDPHDTNADELLEHWLKTETDLFTLLERSDGERRLAACRNFEEHVSTVLSILQRRRARRGRSLEIHLETLFTARGLPYERQVETEPGSTSDFILPGIAAYRALPGSGADAGVLHLGAKSTARERWKQVLSEATRLRRRHLATLDPQLSDASLAAMLRNDVVPVMPARLGALYANDGILDVEEFIERAAWTIGRI